MERRKLYEKITENYAEKILKWTVRKTGSRTEGEDLTQEVFLRIFQAIDKGSDIKKMENYIWKVAHFVWCDRLRVRAKVRSESLTEDVWDGEDFTGALADREELEAAIAKMRRNVADLSKTQREAVILHYLDGLPVAAVAAKLGVAESAVTWHLYDARRKMRKELTAMKEETSYLYRPGKLSLGGSGLLGPDPDIKRVNDSLIRQNLCLLCYREPKSTDDLSKLTGIPKPYLEFDLDWLTEHEFLSLDGKSYRTIIPITGRKHAQEVGALYQSTRGEYLEKIIGYLWGHIQAIREIGFFGSDFPADRLMWSMIMLFLSYASRNSALLSGLKERDEREYRPDGGRYYVVGNDLSDNQDVDPNGYHKPDGWNRFYGICSDSCSSQGEEETYYWLGVYNFAGHEHRPEIIDEKNKPMQKLLHRLYTSLIRSDFSVSDLSPDEQEKLAEAIRKKLVEKRGDDYAPRFPILTKVQLNRLQEEVFAPLLCETEPEAENLAKRIKKLHAKNLPPVNKGYIDYLTYLDLWNFGIYTMIFAAEEGKLLLPKTPEEGAPLTLVLIR